MSNNRVGLSETTQQEKSDFQIFLQFIFWYFKSQYSKSHFTPSQPSKCVGHYAQDMDFFSTDFLETICLSLWGEDVSSWLLRAFNPHTLDVKWLLISLIFHRQCPVLMTGMWPLQPMQECKILAHHYRLCH